MVSELRQRPELRQVKDPKEWMWALHLEPKPGIDWIAEWYFAWRCIDATTPRQLAML